MVSNIEIQKFFRKVDFREDTECWNWNRARDKDGYGIYYFDGRNRRAHRVSYFFANGFIDSDLVVRHKCHNTSCVNPFHLELGTQKDNIQDCIKANRKYRKFGTAHHLNKFSDDQILRIREMAKEVTCNRKELASMYGVHVSCINKIIRKFSWSHL